MPEPLFKSLSIFVLSQRKTQLTTRDFALQISMRLTLLQRRETSVELGSGSADQITAHRNPALAGGKFGAKEPNMRNLISSFVRDEVGAAAVEYALIAAGILVAIIAVLIQTSARI